MNNKRGELKEVKVFFIIANLILATFAFSWMVSAAIEQRYDPVAEEWRYFNTENDQWMDPSYVPENIAKQTSTENTPAPGSSPPTPAPNPSAISSGALSASQLIKAKPRLQYTFMDNYDVLDKSGKITGTIPKGSSYTTDASGAITTDYGTLSSEELQTINSKGIVNQAGVSTSTASQTWASKYLGFTSGGAMDALATGALWAGIAFGAGYMLGGLFGMDDGAKMAMSSALAAGAFTFRSLSVLNTGTSSLKTFLMGSGPGKFMLANPIVPALVIGGIVFVLMYKKESKQIVSFSCNPWQAPTKGEDCQKCNEKEGCSQYKCKSLGQGCQILNAGTKEEKCAWINPRDTKSPGISPWEDVLTKGYEYGDVRIRPPGDGSEPGRMRIQKKGGGCVEAFIPLQFGIVTIGPDGETEPAQCKVDYNHTLKFDDMSFWFGESNMYRYNHTQKLALPSPASINAVAPELENDGTYSLYVRCKDGNGNENVDEFVIQFCVNKGADTTPPKVEGTSIANEMPVKFNQSNVPLEVYVNEPAECKWSREDRTYENMENQMQCSNNVWEMNNNMVYTCKTELTGVKNREENKFYFRCKDQPLLQSGRNTMAESYVYTLFGTEPLNILSVSPNGTIKGATEVISVNIEIETANGYKNGEAICYYSATQNEADYIEFFETGTSLHKQRLDLTAGTYKYFLKCVDLGGNRDDNSTDFVISVDTEAPKIVRVYRDAELLKVVASEDSECRYSTQSCNFKFEDGIDMPYANQTSHVAEWKTDSTYYIRCSDQYGNMPTSNTCSIIVRPYDVVEQKVNE